MVLVMVLETDREQGTVFGTFASCFILEQQLLRQKGVGSLLPIFVVKRNKRNYKIVSIAGCFKEDLVCKLSLSSLPVTLTGNE